MKGGEGHVNERWLSPLARRRRQIVNDIELMIAYAAGALSTAVVWMLARMMGVG